MILCPGGWSRAGGPGLHAAWASEVLLRAQVVKLAGSAWAHACRVSMMPPDRDVGGLRQGRQLGRRGEGGRDRRGSAATEEPRDAASPGFLQVEPWVCGSGAWSVLALNSPLPSPPLTFRRKPLDATFLSAAILTLVLFTLEFQSQGRLIGLMPPAPLCVAHH